MSDKTEIDGLCDWLETMASGPMSCNPEHTDTCNKLSEIAALILRLAARCEELEKRLEEHEALLLLNEELNEDRCHE